MDCVNYFRMVIPKTRQTNSSTLKVSLTKTTIHVISIILHVKGDFLPEKKMYKQATTTSFGSNGE